MHLKRCNLTGCWVNPVKLLYSRITIALRPVRRRAQVIPAHRKPQINLQHEFYIKDLKTNKRVQIHSGSLKPSLKYNTVTTTTIQNELHILPTDVMPTCPIFTGKTGPTRQSPRRKRLSNPGRTYLLEVRGNTTCSEGLQQQP